MEKVSLNTISKDLKDSQNNKHFQNSKNSSQKENNNKNNILLKIKTPDDNSFTKGFGQIFSCVA